MEKLWQNGEKKRETKIKSTPENQLNRQKPKIESEKRKLNENGRKVQRKTTIDAMVAFVYKCINVRAVQFEDRTCTVVL